MINAILQTNVKGYKVTTANFQLQIGNIFCGPPKQRLAPSKFHKRFSINGCERRLDWSLAEPGTDGFELLGLATQPTRYQQDVITGVSFANGIKQPGDQQQGCRLILYTPDLHIALE